MSRQDYDAELYTTFAEVEGYGITELEQIIPVLDTLFGEGQDCVNPLNDKAVPDNVYDLMRARLSELYPESDVLKNVTAADFQITSNKIAHDPPMTSISKANGTLDEKDEILKKWLKDCCDELKYDPKKVKTPLFVTSYKHDGVALALYYEKGKLVAAGLRPNDGVNAELVTENAQYIDGVHTTLPIDFTGRIRGEVTCKISVFDKIVAEIIKDGKKNKYDWTNKKPPANPRNYAAGAIRQFDDPTVTKKRKLQFTAYAIDNHDNPPYKTEIERSEWCRNELGIPFVLLKPFHYDNLAEMENGVTALDFEVDGIVISVNNIEDGEQLGTHGSSVTGNPRGKLAWKFKEKSAVVTVNNIRWQTGRTGRVTPVLEFDGVQLAGTTVSNCTIHNVGIVKSGGIGVGAKVRIIKSGKIIPKVIKVEKKSGNVAYPDNCPSCGSRLSIVVGKTGTDLVCQNDKCAAQNMQTLLHYLMTFGVKGIGPSKAESMVSFGLVRCPADFYGLEVDDLTDAGFKERTATLIIAAIHMVTNPEKTKDNNKLLAKIDKARLKLKTIPLAKFFASLGIVGAGKGTGRALAEHFDSLDDIRNASIEDLEKVEDVGNITAVAVYEYLKDNADDIDELLMHVEVEVPKTGKLSGKSFCFTGAPPSGKTFWIDLVEASGGIVKSSVSKKIDYVVIGENSGSKAIKAKELQASGHPLVIIEDIKDLEKLLK